MVIPRGGPVTPRLAIIFIIIRICIRGQLVGQMGAWAAIFLPQEEPPPLTTITVWSGGGGGDKFAANALTPICSNQTNDDRSRNLISLVVYGRSICIELPVPQLVLKHRRTLLALAVINILAWCGRTVRPKASSNHHIKCDVISSQVIEKEQHYWIGHYKPLNSTLNYLEGTEEKKSTLPFSGYEIYATNNNDSRRTVNRYLGSGQIKMQRCQWAE